MYKHRLRDVAVAPSVASLPLLCSSLVSAARWCFLSLVISGITNCLVGAVALPGSQSQS